ncbi:hypothetical protein LCGC14_0196270 [marine sediment metagenome]|uniref:Uncharacterized protein n=1 Tax=marine sediment metagenome TaxID=412755 RepID=A0A0F9UQ72_9ZZZZ
MTKKHKCPKCGSDDIVAAGALTVNLKTGKIHSIQTLTHFECLDCKFTEDWIPQDGSPIFSELEKEWLK